MLRGSGKSLSAKLSWTLPVIVMYLRTFFLTGFPGNFVLPVNQKQTTASFSRSPAIDSSEDSGVDIPARKKDNS